jgi:aspartate-semialdehyde dehydrogenase
MDIKVGVLGATGAVGQRFVQLLDGHPWFRVTALAASSRSAGYTYEEACHWVLDTPMPEWARAMPVLPTSPKASFDCQLLFSALPGHLAGEIEESFAEAGYLICSNASAHRMDADVPLIIPEANADHLELIETQRAERGWSGYIVAAANCSSTHLTLGMAPLEQAFGLDQVSVVTLQAISGAGYPGVASMDILGNVIPYISGEEEKLEEEMAKILGTLQGNKIQPADMVISAQCTRVPVQDGHTECVSIKLSQSATRDEIRETWRDYRSTPQELELPSAPAQPIIVMEEPDRPQPRLDRDVANGMATVIGRLRPCSIFDYKFILLGHNTLRGAAGGALLNAELLVAKGWVT